LVQKRFVFNAMGENTGRPTDYTEDLVNSICERIADGESLKHITDGADMPSRVTVHAWLIKHPSFLNKYEAAREMQADVYADEMEEIARDTTLDVQRARLIVDTRKWVAAKLKPKKYGEKIDHTTNGKDLPIPILGGMAKNVSTDDGNQEAV
jgi:hypothetical protein